MLLVDPRAIAQRMTVPLSCRYMAKLEEVVYDRLLLITDAELKVGWRLCQSRPVAHRR